MPENDTAATARLREAEAQAQREAESRRQRREGQDTSDEIDEQREVDQAMRAASGQEKRDTTDIDQDRLAGKKTLTVRIGKRATQVLYTVLVVAAFLTQQIDAWNNSDN